VSFLRRLLDAPTTWAPLDAVAAPLRRGVRMVPDPVRRALHGTWLGHPVHPVAVQVTVGCYVGAAVLDVLSLPAAPDRRGGMRDAAASLLAVGVASSAVSVATGLADWGDLPPRQQRLGLTHAAVNGAGTVLAGVVAAGRRGSDHTGVPWGSLAVSGAVGVGAALGGHLAYRWSAGSDHAVPGTTAAPAVPLTAPPPATPAVPPVEAPAPG
jgi:uncharacterized membrane protein